jgi:hypothetical protein
MYRIQRTKQKERRQNTIFNTVILIGSPGQNAEAKNRSEQPRVRRLQYRNPGKLEERQRRFRFKNAYLKHVPRQRRFLEKPQQRMAFRNTLWA